MADYFSKYRKEIYLDNIQWPGHIVVSKVDNVEAKPPLAPHIHKGCFEMCFFYKGQQTYEIGDKTYTVRGGEMIFTRPDEPHSTRGNPEEKSGFYYLIFQLLPGERLLTVGAEEATMMYDILMQSENRIFTYPPECLSVFDSIFKAYIEKPALYKAWIASLIVNLLYITLQEVLRGKSQSPSVRPQIQTIIERISKHPELAFTTSQIAGECNLSVPRVIQEFKLATGTTLHDFQLRKRMELAQQRLEQGSSITTTAYELGFSSSQHFSTMFKKYMGITPRAYRLSKRGASKPMDANEQKP